jgi:cytosine/adenosine deaminase-related metal-dependent hydrolase
MPDTALKLMADAVRETGRGVHVHVAEDRYDVSHSHHMHGKDVIVRLNDAGLINDKALLVHGVYLSDQDIAIINAQDAFLAHNARSNMNNNVGYSTKLPLYKNLVLGTDGMGSDMWEEARFAYFKHKDTAGPLWPDSYLRFLHNGNELLKRYFDADFGRVAPGYKADLTVLDYQPPTPLVPGNIGGHIAFGISSRDVITVIINGKVVLEDRQFAFDVSPIYTQARRAAQRLWDKMDQLP